MGIPICTYSKVDEIPFQLNYETEVTILVEVEDLVGEWHNPCLKRDNFEAIKDEVDFI